MKLEKVSPLNKERTPLRWSCLSIRDSKAMRKSANMIIMMASPASPNMTENRNGNVITVNNAAEQERERYHREQRKWKRNTDTLKQP